MALGADALQRADSVEAGQGDIHDGYVRAQSSRKRTNPSSPSPAAWTSYP
ncbi:hypothetical protein NJL88_13465 [Streptomyces sp. DK15]|nr:hypothetical protein [Streptomyces sp. DK15]MDX2391046.1 hypothetical protein [Streptomyces sp. DK15]